MDLSWDPLLLFFFFWWNWDGVKNGQKWTRIISYPLSLSTMNIFLIACLHNQPYSKIYTLQVWRWEQHIYLKCQYPSTELDGVTTLKTTILIITTTKTWKLWPLLFKTVKWLVFVTALSLKKKKKTTTPISDPYLSNRNITFMFIWQLHYIILWLNHQPEQS